MISDKFGQLIFTEKDICELYLTNPERKMKNVLSKDSMPNILILDNFPEIRYYIEDNSTVEEFDNIKQNQWLMPKQYQELDIAQYVLDQCKTEAELQRAGQELLLFQERNMFPLLQYLKYLVDTMRSNNIVWGVGRGSSVASFVLFLIGIHKINSLYYDLPIEEFLK
jgi:DNA polymerase III alpha subunit